MENYRELKERQQKEVNAFPIGFAFSNEQLESELKRLETKKKDVISIGFGGFIRKKDKENYLAMFDKFDKELKQAMSNDEFVISMFEYEMENHEYCIMFDDEEIVESCGLSMKEMNERLCKLFLQAKSNYLDSCRL